MDSITSSKSTVIVVVLDSCFHKNELTIYCCSHSCLRIVNCQNQDEWVGVFGDLGGVFFVFSYLELSTMALDCCLHSCIRIYTAKTEGECHKLDQLPNL